MSTEQQRRTVQDSLTRLRELFTDACKSWDLQVPSMADPLDQESANRLHPFGPVNIDKLRQDISATTKSVNHILEEYETSGLADAEKIGQPADAALRKFVTSIKDEANISQAVSRFSKAIQDCQDISRMPSASKGDSIGFDKRLDLLRKLAEELGLATYVDASGGEETGITTLTLSGTVIVVDIDLHPTSEASKIKVQYAIEVDQDPRIDKLLTENLKHQDYEALGKNLKALAIIDRFNKTYSPVDFFTLLRLLSNDFKTICSHELEAAMDDLQKTLLQGHGMPMAHYKRPGPNIAYWGSKADLVDVDWFSLREAVQLGECSMEMPRLHWMWITTEEQTNDIVFLPPAHSSYLVQASGGEDVEQAADPNVATIQELIFPHFVIAQRFHQPLPGGPNTAPARFVAYLDPPVIATADIAQQISLLVGQTTDMTIDDSTAKHDNEQDTAKELTLEELYSQYPKMDSMIKGRILNIIHRIPYTCYLKNREGRLYSTPQRTEELERLTIPTYLGPKTLFENDDWRMTQRRGHSALYSGLQSLSDVAETVIVGWSGELLQDETDEPVPEDEVSDREKASLRHALQERGVVPIFLKEEAAIGHYEGYCKSMLWPLLHYVQWDDATDGRIEKKKWEQYVVVNQIFAEAVAKEYRPGDIVCIHDYHLLLLPQLLRKLIPNIGIGLFMHAPFPSSEIFRNLPKRGEILKGMLGSTLIGFQTYSYSKHFVSSCTRVLGYESTPVGVDNQGLTVAIGTFPIGIDDKKIGQWCKDPAVLPKMAAVRELYADKYIIVGRDKLDLWKGIIEKLSAFEKFLADYPEWRGKVVLIQVTSPATTDTPKVEGKISELVAHINASYGSLEFKPVHYVQHHIERDEYYALLSVADIALITSVRDGMNTTSFDYVICQQEKKGSLILSEFTGTAGNLGGAILVNPWDHKSTANAIHDCLTMSDEERISRYNHLLSHVTTYNARYWAHSFVKQLVQQIRLLEEESNPTPLLDIDKMLTQWKEAKRRILFFDYDGTLTAIRKQPMAAIPPPEMLKYLQMLCHDPQNTVWVISGRDQGALEGWLGKVNGLGLSAEHGCFLKQPDTAKWVNLTESMDMGWKNDVIEIFTYYTERTQGSFIEHKRSSITWHYRMADPEYGSFQAKECQNHLENAILSKLPVEILVGKKNLEVRPTMVNKGEIVKRLMAAHEGADFILCAGDDKTDEDMFLALKGRSIPFGNDDHCFSVSVGPSDKKTLANWHVPTPEDIVKVLGVLSGSLPLNGQDKL
ncbi:hypothetical protein BZG36_03144 [Bifiguratus adelaidae]|uniref:Mediator of RNA polymerase II transcription subunit 1 n=1 Tax=Bifiguratus adelaidae TaxID=1938954 RepID=A0A261XXA7_9FUNG|nr:hypothetical protein BZG36_03144 [Bifiguratus adelaidae]